MIRTQTDNQWIKVLKPIPHARLRLLCFPFAGGGIQLFRDWCEYLPGRIELWAIQLPGRESRIREKLITNYIDLIKAIIGAVKGWIQKPYAIFGHSMGALLGYEFAQAIRSVGLSQPCRLVVSSRRAPHLPRILPLMHNLPDEQFIKEVKCLNGTPREVMESQELLELIMPILRADFKLCETYTYDNKAPLGCPITAYGGLQDHTVSREELDAWRHQTTGTFNLRMFPGGHFYIQSSKSLFFQFFINDLLAVIKNI